MILFVTAENKDQVKKEIEDVPEKKDNAQPNNLNQLFQCIAWMTSNLLDEIFLLGNVDDRTKASVRLMMNNHFFSEIMQICEKELLGEGAPNTFLMASPSELPNLPKEIGKHWPERLKDTIKNMKIISWCRDSCFHFVFCGIGGALLEIKEEDSLLLLFHCVYELVGYDFELAEEEGLKPIQFKDLFEDIRKATPQEKQPIGEDNRKEPGIDLQYVAVDPNEFDIDRQRRAEEKARKKEQEQKDQEQKEEERPGLAGEAENNKKDQQEKHPIDEDKPLIVLQYDNPNESDVERQWRIDREEKARKEQEQKEKEEKEEPKPEDNVADQQEKGGPPNNQELGQERKEKGEPKPEDNEEDQHEKLAQKRKEKGRLRLAREEENDEEDQQEEPFIKFKDGFQNGDEAPEPVLEIKKDYPEKNSEGSDVVVPKQKKAENDFGPDLMKENIGVQGKQEEGPGPENNIGYQQEAQLKINSKIFVEHQEPAKKNSENGEVVNDAEEEEVDKNDEKEKEEDEQLFSIEQISILIGVFVLCALLILLVLKKMH